MTAHYDDLENRTTDQRNAAIAELLPRRVARAAALPGYSEAFASVDPAAVTSREALAALPVLRKSDLIARQADAPPLGGYAAREATAFHHLFQSPGPIHEPGMTGADWWRLGRFLHAAGIGAGDLVQNCFGYHLTPGGHIFESGARAVGAAVIPAGPGQTDAQVAAASALGATRASPNLPDLAGRVPGGPSRLPSGVGSGIPPREGAIEGHGAGATACSVLMSATSIALSSTTA